jgi:hypothetical protein
MQDGDTGQQPTVDALPPLHALPPRRRGGGKAVLTAALLAFMLGGGLAGWLVWHGDLDAVLPEPARSTKILASTAGNPAVPGPARLSGQPTVSNTTSAEHDLGGVETRLALLEDRFSRIDQQSNAAAANAARAEALLIAFAARRITDKGESLGYLEYQLKLRFGAAQPQAVQTIIDAAKQPVTLYQLSTQLDAAAPALSGERRDESTWSKVSREFASLFVVRRSASPTARQLDRADRAQLLLKAGKVEDAIAEVERLPGADDAKDWIASARRYAEAQRALEIIETAAMLEPRGLRDGTGLAINQPSPLSPPADGSRPTN